MIATIKIIGLLSQIALLECLDKDKYILGLIADILFVASVVATGVLS